MKKIFVDETVLQQALEVLEDWDSPVALPAIIALRAALVQEPVQEPMQESALQAVAEKIGDQCAVWYGIGARDVEEVLREAARYGLVRAAQAEPVQCSNTFGCRCPKHYTAPPKTEPTRSQKMANAGFSRRPGLWALQTREALELIAAPQRPDGTWNRDREACRQLAAEALGRYDDE